ncbi:MAG: YIP1 family protein [Acidobacteriota bacterium]|jgi:hypothetical protein|nr:YIP1 family protein [Acidobacteriota bacterium]
MEPENGGGVVTTEVPQAKNFFARLGGVFFSPREAFEEIGRAPRLLLPIVVTVILTVAGTWCVMTKVDTTAMTAAALEQAVARGQITEEQMEQQLALMSTAAPVAAGVAGGVMALVLALAIAGYGKLFSMFAAAENKYKSLLEVSLYATIAVGVVQTLVMAVILLSKGAGKIQATDAASVVASSLGAIIAVVAGDDALPEFPMLLAKAIDIFTIWNVALLAIGFAAVSKRLTTATAAAWLGGAYAVYAVGNAAIRAML